MNTLRKALFRALEKSDLNMLRAVLAQGVSLAFEDGDRDPVCFVAMGDIPSDIEVLQCLHAAGADLHAREPQYLDSLLHWAVKHEGNRLLPWLIEQGLDVNAQNIKGRTAMAFAIPAMAPCTTSEDGVLALRDVALLLANGAQVDLASEDGSTPLMRAAEAGAPEVIALLLSHGANPKAQQTDGSTALHLIGYLQPENVQSGHLEVIDHLLAAGADPEARDEDGWTPLISTSVNGNLIVFQHLLQRGANPNAGEGNVLRQLIFDGNEGLLDRLLEAGIQLDLAHGDEALLPLGLAAYNGFLHGVKSLLERGVDIEGVNVDGETALLMAACKCEYEVVAYLLSRGANPHHNDHYGNTALGWAQRRGDARLIELLSE
ncbi:ankyrin repeat family protein [Asticcacaulis biprosthecium C19]|uniref:Ankyrin repeat family protein n=1 Tax=Asticcacaulis biprosthecium C19 TaxID=715226 RepID=F4QMN7_9CAUL|nr:ankyrin repeat domain-containing protein [Asticcacaulis biprosthecium]EGF91478.1 ankyrin repeat family protein [Asticcacaulis biprosthecium C19]